MGMATSVKPRLTEDLLTWHACTAGDCTFKWSYTGCQKVKLDSWGSHYWTQLLCSFDSRHIPALIRNQQYFVQSICTKSLSRSPYFSFSHNFLSDKYFSMAKQIEPPFTIGVHYIGSGWFKHDSKYNVVGSTFNWHYYWNNKGKEFWWLQRCIQGILISWTSRTMKISS